MSTPCQILKFKVAYNKSSLKKYLQRKIDFPWLPVLVCNSKIKLEAKLTSSEALEFISLRTALGSLCSNASVSSDSRKLKLQEKVPLEACFNLPRKTGCVAPRHRFQWQEGGELCSTSYKFYGHSRASFAWCSQYTKSLQEEHPGNQYWWSLLWLLES